MAFRIGDALECAELFFTKTTYTHGFLKFVGDEQHYRIELTGTCEPDLRGKQIGVWPNPDIPRDPVNPEMVKGFNPRQVGTTGHMTAARWVKHHDCSPEELINRARAGELPPFQWKRCLYLEWFSQNGRVLIELVDPILHMYVSGSGDDEIWTDLPEPEGKPEDQDFTSDPHDDDASKAREAVPFGQPSYAPRMDGSIFPDLEEEAKGAPEYNPSHDLESYLNSLSQATDVSAGIEGPEADDFFIKEMDYLEDVIEGKHDDDDPLITVLPECDYENISEEEAEAALKAALAVMALHSMVLHTCEHQTAKEALEFLYGDYAKEGRIHPGFLGGDWVTHVDASEQCPDCLEIIMKDYEDLDKKNERRRAEDPDYNPDRRTMDDPPF